MATRTDRFILISAPLAWSQERRYAKNHCGSRQRRRTLRKGHPNAIPACLSAHVGMSTSFVTSLCVRCRISVQKVQDVFARENSIRLMRQIVVARSPWHFRADGHGTLARATDIGAGDQEPFHR